MPLTEFTLLIRAQNRFGSKHCAGPTLGAALTHLGGGFLIKPRLGERNAHFLNAFDEACYRLFPYLNIKISRVFSDRLYKYAEQKWITERISIRLA